MAWEQRKGHRYYFRAKKVAGKVKREYFGRGPDAERAAAQDERQRQERRAQDLPIKAKHERWQAADHLTDTFSAGVRLLVEASLTAAGFHQHDRGQWRKKRMKTAKAKPQEKPEAAAPPTESRQDSLTPEQREQFWNDVVTRARNGDESTVPDLKVLLQANPQAWQHYGDYDREAEEHWLRLATGNDVFQRECLRLKLADFKKQHAEPSDSSLAKLLVDQLALYWLQSEYMTIRDASTTSKPLPIAGMDFVQRRVDHAQRRLLAVTKTLATVRKLLKPALSPYDLATRSVPETTGSLGSRSGCGCPDRVGVPVAN